MEGDPNPHLQLDDRDLLHLQGVVADLEELELQLHLRHLHLDPHLHGVVAELEVPLLLTVAEFDAPLLLTVLGLAPDLFCFCFYLFVASASGPLPRSSASGSAGRRSTAPSAAVAADRPRARPRPFLLLFFFFLLLRQVDLALALELRKMEQQPAWELELLDLLQHQIRAEQASRLIFHFEFEAITDVSRTDVCELGVSNLR